MKSAAKWTALSLALVSPLVLAACGGDSPLSPSGQGVVLRGTVLGAASASSASASSAGRAASAASADTITVTVGGHPDITTTVSADGSFTLRGLPPGSFTLVFSRMDGSVIGSLTFSAVLPNQEITITVDVSGGILVLLDERRTGIGHVDIEIQGLVEAVLAVPAGAPAGENRFQIRGYTVVTRPGQTAIREGNQARTVADVTVGRQVHVKGEWLPAESPNGGSTQPVLAHEIKLQGDEEEDGETARTCMIAGGRVGEKIQLEGNVASGDSSRFDLRVNGNRATDLVQVDTNDATFFQCHPGGPNAPTLEQCKAMVVAPAKVHVSGTLMSCDLEAAQVTASKVIVQK